MSKRRQQSEGSVYRRQDGRWAAVADLGWRDGRRDRRYFYGATVAEAVEKRLRFASRRLDGFTMPKGRPPYTGEWVLHWLHNVVRDRVQDTTWQKSYRQKVEDHIAPWFARVRLSTDDLTEEVVEQWHRHLRARVSGTTAQHCHRLLSAALKEAVIRGRLARNPAANVPAPARSTVEAVPPGDDEVLAILAVCAGESAPAHPQAADAIPAAPVSVAEPAPIFIARDRVEQRTEPLAGSADEPLHTSDDNAEGAPAGPAGPGRDRASRGGGDREPVKWAPAARPDSPAAPGHPFPERLPLMGSPEPQGSGWRTGARWVTGIATGIRQGEALGLLWPHVDLDAGTLNVEWELVRLPWQHGCGGSGSASRSQFAFETPGPRPADPGAAYPCGRRATSCPLRHSGGLRLKRPKTPASRAAVPLAPFAVAALKRWRAGQKAERLAHPSWRGWACECGQESGHPQGQKPAQNRVRAGQTVRRRGQLVCPDCGKPSRPDLVVFSQPNGTPTDPRRDWGDWQDLLTAAGLPAGRVHDLRHSFATMLWHQGMGMKEISRLMRHANESVTSTIYTHFREEWNRAAADVIEQAFRKRRPHP